MRNFVKRLVWLKQASICLRQGPDRSVCADNAWNGGKAADRASPSVFGLLFEPISCNTYCHATGPSLWPRPRPPTHPSESTHCRSPRPCPVLPLPPGPAACLPCCPCSSAHTAISLRQGSMAVLCCLIPTELQFGS